MSRYNGEQVLVVPREIFEQVGAFNGVRLNPQDYLSAFLKPGIARFIDREIAEQSPQYKQIIAYAIFCHDGRVLSYARTSKGNEARLHDKYSLGIGGHINPVDGIADSLSTYLSGVEREIRGDRRGKRAAAPVRIRFFDTRVNFRETGRGVSRKREHVENLRASAVPAL